VKQTIERLQVIRFPLIVGIVFIHTADPIFNTMSPVPLFVRNFISYGIASVAVPIFFLISGYLFFYNLEWSNKAYLKKVKSRILTLLLPYLFWNFFALTYMVLIFHSLSAGTSQMWFLQELMALALLAPVFHLMHKKMPILFLVIMLFVWLFRDWHTSFPVMSSMMPALFFYAGSVVAAKKGSLFTLDKYELAFVVISLIAFTCDTLWHPQGLLIHNIGILAGIPAGLYLAKFLLSKKVKSVFLWLGSASFFVFCFHQPILAQTLNRFVNWYKPDNDIIKIALYFAFPVVTIGVAVALFRFVGKVSPSIAEFINGGRI
jgi:peptidoglycan/LPS O-acetylase OafA/YrhL